MNDDNAQALVILDLIDAHGDLYGMLGCRHDRCHADACSALNEAVTNTLPLPRESAEILAQDEAIDPAKVKTIGDAACVLTGYSEDYL
jgi:hypothetical protein